MRKCCMNTNLELTTWLFLEQREETNGISVLDLFNMSFNWEIVFLFQYISAAIRGESPSTCYKFWKANITATAKCRYYNLGSTRARTITRVCVLVNMCHIKFAVTGRKERSEDRNAVGINVELGSPFLQGISCLVERWGPDRELWHSVLSHLGVLQLKTHMLSWPSKCVWV